MIHGKTILRSVATAAILLPLVGCFKSVVTYTRFDIAVYRQLAPDGDFLRARNLDTYAYYVDTRRPTCGARSTRRASTNARWF